MNYFKFKYIQKELKLKSNSSNLFKYKFNTQKKSFCDKLKNDQIKKQENDKINKINIVNETKSNTINTPNNINTNTNTETSQPKLSLFGKLKRYGMAGVGLYITLWASGFLVFYGLTRKKYINKDTVLKYWDDQGLNNYVDIKAFKDKYGEEYLDLLVAYVINYAFDLIRLPGCLFILTIWFKKKK